MMSLKIQCFSLVISLLYGILFSFLVKVNYKFLFTNGCLKKVIYNFLFMLDISLGYFFLIKIINNGILHIYFLVMFFLGCYFGYMIIVKFLKK